MPASSSRDFILRYSADNVTYNAIAAVRAKSASIDNTPVDITTDDEDGLQTLLDDIGTSIVSVECSGISTDNVVSTLAAAASAGSALHYFQVQVQGRTYTGQWFISNYTWNGSGSDQATEFSFTLTSSGTITSASV